MDGFVQFILGTKFLLYVKLVKLIRVKSGSRTNGEHSRSGKKVRIRISNNACSGALEAHPRAFGADPGRFEADPGSFEAQRGVMEAAGTFGLFQYRLQWIAGTFVLFLVGSIFRVEYRYFQQKTTGIFKTILSK
jgi:hypothetical protein